MKFRCPPKTETEKERSRKLLLAKFVMCPTAKNWPDKSCQTLKNEQQVFILSPLAHNVPGICEGMELLIVQSEKKPDWKYKVEVRIKRLK